MINPAATRRIRRPTQIVFHVVARGFGILRAGFGELLGEITFELVNSYLYLKLMMVIISLKSISCFETEEHQYRENSRKHFRP